MRRREFIGAFAGAVGALPFSVHSQTRPPAQIAILMGVAEDPEGRSRVATFQEGLQTLGWTEGVNLRTQVRWSAGDPERAKTYAAELVATGPQAILSNSAPATRAIKEVTASVPVVFTQVNDPVGQGFVTNLARPEGNITGFLNFEPAMGGKWLELLKEARPALSHVGVLYSEATAQRGSGGGVYLSSIRSFAPVVKVEIVPAPVRDAAEIDGAIAKVAQSATPGLIVLPDIFNTVHRESIGNAAIRHQLPSVYPYRYFVAGGGLMSYGIEVADLYKRAASYVDRILRGAKPADLPVQAPAKFELVVNRKAATALGVEFPPSILARADQVIE